jgi:predicted transcriptional regulator
MEMKKLNNEAPLAAVIQTKRRNPEGQCGTLSTDTVYAHNNGDARGKKTTQKPFTRVNIDALTDERLSMFDIATLITLASFADNKTNEAFPSIATIATYTSCSESTVKRSLKKLAACNFIKIFRYTEHNIYKLNAPRQFLMLDCEIWKRGELSIRDRVVYVALLYLNEKANPSSEMITRSRLEIAQIAKLCPRLISASLHTLEKVGLIAIEVQNGKKNRYKLRQKVAEISPSSVTLDQCLSDLRIICSGLYKNNSLREREKFAQHPEKMREKDIAFSMVPLVMRKVVDHFAGATGREAFTLEEINSLLTLEKHHTPHRIIAEIDRVCAIFRSKGKPLSSLYLQYIWACLKGQNTWFRDNSKNTKRAIKHYAGYDDLLSCVAQMNHVNMTKFEGVNGHE